MLAVVGTESIRADQFCVAVSFMCRCNPQWPHLMQHNRHAGVRKLPGGLRTGEAAANDTHGLNLVRCHSMIIRLTGGKLQRR